ncbi:MAG: hypothetical protein QM756_01345 [Polyangiaceae bacterium]
MALSRFALCFSLLALACSSNVGASRVAKSCNDACQAQVAARGLRETLKLAYNLTLNGKPVGAEALHTRAWAAACAFMAKPTRTPNKARPTSI